CQYDKLKAKFANCTRFLCDLERDLKTMIAYNRLLDKERNALKPSLQYLGRQRKVLQQILQHNTEEINLHIHKNEGTWLIPGCTRTESEQLLHAKRNGTFL